MSRKRGPKRSSMSSVKRRKIKNDIRLRDGENCFYCNIKMDFEIQAPDSPGNRDVTIEHILDNKYNRRNFKGNFALVHHRCNQNVDGMTVEEKLNTRVSKDRNHPIYAIWC